MNKKTVSSGAWRRVALQASALMVLWLVMSGLYDGFHIGLGVVSVVLIVTMNFSSALASEGAIHPAQAPRWGRIVLYVPWLVMEMALAGLHVAKVVLTPQMPLDPRLIRFKSDQPNDVARVILGNSITLTPGTLTVDIGKQEYLIHALTRTTAEGLLDGTMQTRIARLFVDNPQHMVFDTSIATSRPARAAK